MEMAKYLLANECSLTMHSLESTLATGENLDCVGKYNTLAGLLEALPQPQVRAVIADRFLLGDAPPAFAQHFGDQSDLRLIAFCPNDCAHLDPLPLIALGQ